MEQLQWQSQQIATGRMLPCPPQSGLVVVVMVVEEKGSKRESLSYERAACVRACACVRVRACVCVRACVRACGQLDKAALQHTQTRWRDTACERGFLTEGT